MKTAFVNDNTRYIFHLNDAGTDPFLTLVINPFNPAIPERITKIPVRENAAFAIKLNKGSVSAAGGSYGLFKLIKRYIDTDFAMYWVYKIIEHVEKW